MADIGRTIGGRYKLVEALGEDEISTVFRAQDVEAKTAVTLRVLHPDLARDQDFVAEYRLQTRAAARLEHPSIVAVYDFGGDEKGVYLITELVEGQTLGLLLQRNGPVPPRRAASVTSIVADAVAAAHEQGLVHGGLRSDKILVTRDAEIKVADFGLARALSESANPPELDVEQAAYASPEQLRGRRATDSSDIYSLGVLLFELLTGHYPWPGDTAREIAGQREAEPAPRPSDLRDGVPASVEAICRKAMSPDVTRRYQSAAAMAEALQQAIESLDSGQPEQARAATPPVLETDLPEPPAYSRPELSTRAAPVPPPTPVSLPTPPVVRRANPLGQGSGAYSPDDYAVAPQPVRPGRSVAPLNAAETRYSGSLDDDMSLGTRRMPRRINPADGESEPMPDDDEQQVSMWAWVAGFLALFLVTLIFLTIFLLLNRNAPAGAVVYAPDLTDLPLATAQQQARDAQLELVATYTPNNSNKEDNTIAEQDPAAGSPMKHGDRIYVKVRGPQQAKIPNVVGLTEADARNALTSAGLSIGARSDAYDQNVPEGNVISTNPKADTTVDRGTAVDYVVSMGPQPTPTPEPTPSPSPTPSPTPTDTPTPT